MAIREKPVRGPVQLKEFTCEKCQAGVLRATQAHRELDSTWTSQDSYCCPTLWPHTCSHCGAPCDMAVSYPRLSYGGQHWILEKSGCAKVEALRALIRRIHRH